MQVSTGKGARVDETSLGQVVQALDAVVAAINSHYPNERIEGKA